MTRLPALCFALAATACWPTTASAQQLAGLRLDRERAGLMETVKITIDLGSANGENLWCGLQVNFGNGDISEVRADQSPMVVYKQYPNAGNYTVRVVGESLTRGLKSASACRGGPFTATLTVVDAAAERRRADAQRDADAQAQAQAQAGAERDRQVQQREQALLQRSRSLDDREQRLATRERELDDRERRLRNREQQLDQPPAVAVTPPPAAPAPAPAPAPARPREDKTLQIFR